MMTGSLMHVPADFLGNFQDALSVPGASFTDATYDLILVFVYMGTATLLAAYIAQSTLIMTGESQARRVSYISFTSLSIWYLLIHVFFRFESFMCILSSDKIWAGLTRPKKVHLPLVLLLIPNLFKMGKSITHSL